MKIKAYLSGGMRGHPKYNFPRFMKEAARLRKLNYDVYNPAERDLKAGFNPLKDKAQPLSNYLKVDFPAICNSGIVAVLPGWQNSEGSVKETTVAKWCGIPVVPVEALKSKADTVLGMFEQLRNYDESILDTAKRIVNKDRGKAYGRPDLDFGRTAGALNAHGFRIRDPQADPDDPNCKYRMLHAKDIPFIMINVKLSRLMNAYKEDSTVDIAGYAETLASVIKEIGDAPPF